MPATDVSRFSSTRTLVAMLLLLTLGIGALFGRAIWTMREDEWSFARTTNANLVRTLEQGVATTLQGVDRSLSGLASDMGNAQVLALSPDVRARVLFDHSLQVPVIARVAVLDTQGRIVAQLNVPHAVVSAAGLEAIAVHRSAPSAGLVIGRPWKEASTDGHLLPISRSYVDGQGRFAGVVIVALRLDYFSELFGSLKLGPLSGANLFHTDGTLLARLPNIADNVGRNLSGTPNVQRMQRSSEGQFTGMAALDGVERLYTFSHVSGYPLILNVAEATQPILARWRSNAWQLGSFAALLMLACLGLGGMFVRELHRTEQLGETLKQTKHDLHTILDNLPSMVSYWDSALRNRFANHAYLAWFGIAPETLPSTSLPELLGPKVYADSMPYMQRALAGQRQVFERHVVDDAGQERFCIVNYLPDLEDGRVRGVFVQATEITDRKRMENALFEEKERMRLTLASIGEAVLCTDAQARLTYLNPAAERMTGWQAFDAAGRHIDEVAPMQVLQGSASTPASPLRAALAQVQTLGPTRGVALQRRDGQRVDVQESASPITDPNGLVTGGVMVLHDISDTVAMAERMAYLAHYDALTDLPNRVLLRDRVEQALAYAQRNGTSVAVMYLDMDGFKQVNDALGHEMGDLLLVQFARRLCAAVRGSDTVCRQGGDEFVVLLAGPSDADHTALVAEKILAACERGFDLQGRTVQVGVSGGIALYPAHGESFEELSRHADAAMYAAKRSGRGRFYLYTSARTAPVCVVVQGQRDGETDGNPPLA